VLHDLTIWALTEHIFTECITNKIEKKHLFIIRIVTAFLWMSSL